MTDTHQGSWEEAVRWLRDQPGNEKIVRDGYYDDPLIEAADRYWRSEEWVALRAILGNGPGEALDAGAGRGIASYALAMDGFNVTAFEPDPSDLVGGGAIRSLVDQTGLPIRVDENLSECLPFADKSFDVIFARAVLHHITDLPAAMNEYHRVLRPGGIFIAAREHVITDAADLPAFFASHALHDRYGGENAHPLHVYQDAIRRSGLMIERTILSLESPINYGPQSTADLNRRISDRMMPFAPLRPVVAAVLGSPRLAALVYRVASRLDRRPGRHASFVVRKAI
jgi:SAM-dependent methyltransferase